MDRGATSHSAAPDVLGDADVGRRVVHGGALRTGGFVVSNLLTILGAVLLLRYLGVEDFGRYGTVMALLAIVQGVSDVGLTVTATRELASLEDEAERRDLLAHVLTLRVVLSAFGVAAAVGFAALAGYDQQQVAGAALAGLGVIFVSVQAAMLLPLGVELRNGRIALNEILRQFVLVVAWAILVAVSATLAWFFAAQAITGLLLLLLAPLLLHRRHLVVPRRQVHQLLRIAAVALPVAIASVLGIIYFRLLVVLMSVLSDNATQLGYLVTSARIVEAFVGLSLLLFTVMLPVMTVAARDDPARFAYMTGRMTEVMALMGILVALFLAVAAKPLLVALGGPQYADAAPVLRIQACALVTIFVTAAWSPALIGMGRQRALAIAAAVGVAAVLVAGLVLIPPLQAEGAAIAAVAADVILCTATYLALRSGGAADGIDAGRLARIALAALPAIAIGLLVPVPGIIAALITSGAFAGAALALGAVPGEITDAARRLMAGRRAA